MKRAVFLIFLGSLLAAGCRTAPGVTPIVTPELAQTLVSTTLTAAPSPIVSTVTAAPTVTPAVLTATMTPSPEPTPTPKPVVQIYMPAEMPLPWREALQLAVNRLQIKDLSWAWQMTADSNQANIILHPGSEGIAAFQHPLILAVPFTTDWEETSFGQANEILNNGHPLVTVMTWEEMPRTFKALRIDGLLPDDPAYPLQQPWVFVAQPGYETAAGQLAAELQAGPPAQSRVHLASVGDIMLDRALGYAIERGSLAYPFEQVAHLLTQADITVGNLESALGDVGEPAPKSYTFRAPPAAAESLALAGFDVVSLANNHGMDYGPEALLQGIELLRQQNVAPIGAGANAAEAHAPHIEEVNGLRLAFLGYVHVPVEGRTAFDVEDWDATENSPGLAWAYPERITADVSAARQQADLVIVILHSGFEYVEAPSEPQIAASYAAIDAGAALVIGHHAHILQGIEFYKEGVIVYGLGNFAFEIDGNPSTAILNVWLTRAGVHQLELIPAIIQFGGQPRLAEAWEARPILQRVYFLTQLLNAR